MGIRYTRYETALGPVSQIKNAKEASQGNSTKEKLRKKKQRDGVSNNSTDFDVIRFITKPFFYKATLPKK